MARALDDMSEFRKFREELLPVIRKDLEAGLSGEEIMRKYESYAAARIISIAAMEQDSGKALAAAKDILDRSQGKAKERSEVTHKLEKLPEEQLDALLLAKLEEAQDEQADDSLPN